VRRRLPAHLARVAILAALAALPPARAQVYVANSGTGTIGEYDATTGAVINASLISGFSNPVALAVSGPYLYVADNTAGTIGEYSTSGSPISPSLISLAGVDGMTVSGPSLYALTTLDFGSLYVYAQSGAGISTPLATNMGLPQGIVVNGTRILVANGALSRINAFSLSGQLLMFPSVTGLASSPAGVALSGSDLFISLPGANRVAEYSRWDSS
jgi:DNA-binding beta-propeller fold protein YncE